MTRLFFTFFLAFCSLSLFAQSQFFDRPLDPARLSPGTDVIPTGNNEYLFSSLFFPGGAIFNGGQANLTRLRPSGAILWSNDYTYPSNLVAGALENWSDYSAYLFGGVHFVTDTLYSAFLTRLNQDGTVLWSKSFDLGGNINWANYGKVDIRTLEEGNALLGVGPGSFASSNGINDLSLLKINQLGELVWGKSYCISCQSDADLTFGNVALTADSGYVVCGGIQYPGMPGFNRDVFLMKVDTAGNIQWTRSYNIPDSISLITQSSAFEATVLPNGHIAIVGEYDRADLTNFHKDGLILQTDAFGTPLNGLLVNLNYSDFDIYLNHLVALDSNTLVIPGSSVQDTLPSEGLEHNFLFQIQLDSGAIDWQSNYFTETVQGFVTFSNGFSPLPGGYAYLANFADGFDSYFPHLIIADLTGRTGCQDTINLAVSPVLTIETTDVVATVQDLNDAVDFTPVVEKFEGYTIDVPLLNIGDSEFFCDPTTLPLDATMAGAESYVWNTGATTPVIQADVPGTYWVEDTSNVRCWILRDTVSFNILPPPVVTIGADTTGFCEFGEATLVAGTVGASSLFWSTGETSSTIIVTTPGIYTVQAENMCGTTIESIDLILPNCTGEPEVCKLELPNAFTPDNDGSNDRFLPLSNCSNYEEYYLRIYSRWGQLVYESTNPTQGWDGRYNSKPLASDLYAWILEYRFPQDDAVRLEKGEVTLLR
ncbi:MAG: gliding motility-associated C-terminal domain-containing protein [Lewinellaceae bacterium]|nr:gliding motility-associated C-terminal domain-containing protein [Lewinellaceae bacterium]